MVATLFVMLLPVMGQEVIAVWPGGAPGSEARKGEPEKKAGAGDFERVTNVHNPTLTVFPAGKPKGLSMIVCPGGGHRHLAVEHEGRNVARLLNEAGITAYVLKYRLARAEGSSYSVEEHALKDVQEALRVVRKREPGRKVGVMGFSAGGHVAALAAARYENAAERPDLQILLYPGLVEGITYPAGAPPAFLLWTADDAIPAGATQSVFEQLRKSGVSVELHVYGKGGHGFGVKPGNTSVVGRTWMARVLDWLGEGGWLN